MFCSMFLSGSLEDAEFVAGCRTQRRTLFPFAEADLTPWNAWVRLGVQSSQSLTFLKARLANRHYGFRSRGPRPASQK